MLLFLYDDIAVTPRVPPIHHSVSPSARYSESHSVHHSVRHSLLTSRESRSPGSCSLVSSTTFQLMRSWRVRALHQSVAAAIGRMGGHVNTQYAQTVSVHIVHTNTCNTQWCSGGMPVKGRGALVVCL